MQLFGLVNSLLLSNPETLRRNLTSVYFACFFFLLISSTGVAQYNAINVLKPMADCALQCQLNKWDNSYEEKALLNRCDLSARLKAG